MKTFTKDDILQKWVDIINDEGYDSGTDNCLLCAKFYDSTKLYRYQCNGCPIAGYTGKPHCEGTPYGMWAAHHIADHLRGRYDKFTCTCEECKELAEIMLDFLKTAMPDGFTIEL